MHSTDHTTEPATRPRHTRYPDDDWRRACARANQDGHTISAVLRAFVRAYADGRIDPPDHH